MAECIKRHRTGDQEDAHEYFVCVLEELHRHDMNAYAEIHQLDEAWLTKDPDMELTSSVHQIFAGIIQSKVTCRQCESASFNYEPFTNLSLELNDCSNVTECLRHFTTSETLGDSNAYQCDKCNHKSEATKQLLIHTLPNILVLQLKRFSFTGIGGEKVARHIGFGMELDMSEFLSRQANGSKDGPMYDLYGVLVHRGESVQCGHYFSFVKHKDNQWIKLDDDQCSPVPPSKVLEQDAYMLFYSRRVARTESLVSQASQVAAPRPEQNQLDPEDAPVFKLPETSATRPGEMRWAKRAKKG